MLDQNEFLRTMQRLVIYGLKRNGQGFAQEVYRAVSSIRGDTEFIAVHPEADSLGGIEVVRTAGAIDPPPDSAMVILNAEDAHRAIDDIARADIRRVWLVLNAATPTNVEHAQSNALQVVKGCPLLFIQGLGFPHNIHRAIARLFGKV